MILPIRIDYYNATFDGGKPQSIVDLKQHNGNSILVDSLKMYMNLAPKEEDIIFYDDSGETITMDEMINMVKSEMSNEQNEE